MIKIEIQKFVESKYAMPKTIHWCFFPRLYSLSTTIFSHFLSKKKIPH